MKRFERELSVDPVPQEGSNKRFSQNESTRELLENVDTSIELTGSLEPVAESLKSVTFSDNTNTDKDETTSAIVPIDPQQTPTETDLSPEIKKLYKTYRSINIELRKYTVEELIPLQNQCVLLEDRKREIIDMLLSGTPDVATSDALHEELDEIRAWREVNLPSMFTLQDKVKQLGEKQLVNLKEHGFSSFEEFWNTHRTTYETWASEKTN